MNSFSNRLRELQEAHDQLISVKNLPTETTNGWYQRYKNPILTADHTPLFWRYDFDENSNPFLMERIGMNAVMNSGAIKWNGKYLVVARVEGYARRPFRKIADAPQEDFVVGHVVFVLAPRGAERDDDERDFQPLQTDALERDDERIPIEAFAWDAAAGAGTLLAGGVTAALTSRRAVRRRRQDSE